MDKKASLLTLFLVIFIDLVGIGIIIPLLPEIFFESALVSPQTSEAARTILLGALLAIFPLGQFFGAPLLGALADKHGRRPILILTLIGGAIGYALFAWGLWINSIFLVFFSRILAGFSAGNISIVKAIIADISDEKSKTKNFGLIGMSFGLGFILGPFLGGVLSNENILPWFGLVTPFCAASALVLINLLFVFLTLKETLEKPADIQITPWTGFQNIKKAFHYPELRILFLTIFLFMFGFTFFTQFFPVFLHQKFGLTTTQIGNIFAYAGVWIAFAQGFLIRPISKRFPPKSVLRVSLFVISFVLPLFLLAPKAYWLYFIFPLIAICNGMNLPNFSTLISNHAGKKAQGEVMGIEQSLTSLAMTIPPIISGVLISMSLAFPIFAASFFLFCAWAVFFFGYREQNRKFQ